MRNTHAELGVFLYNTILSYTVIQRDVLKPSRIIIIMQRLKGDVISDLSRMMMGVTTRLRRWTEFRYAR